MADILRISATFLLIVVLLRKKVSIGRVMLLSAAFLAVLYLMSPEAMLGTAAKALADPVTLRLAVALTLIRVFELVLREKEILGEMTEASKALLRSRKAAMVSMPLLIGMLPSVGGAYFSAPMVDEATKRSKMLQEEKAFINYWFRHPWEFVLPLYPGIVLAAAVTGIELRMLIAANLLPAALMAAGGFLLSMKGVKGRPSGKRISRKGLLSFLPIASVLFLVMALRIKLYASFAIVLAGLFLYYRYSPREVLATLRKGFSLDVIVLIVGVMLFKTTMEESGAVGALSAYFTSKGIPLMPMLFMLPFVTGILTGITVGYVGAAFPLLMSLSGGGTFASIAFAFASGFVGVLLSPVHVCLVLTKEYFKADMGGIYRRTLPASALVLAGAAAVYLLLG
jgi:integral membrane protein (TIGR00529 family)